MVSLRENSGRRMHGVKTRWLLVTWMNDMQDHEVLFSGIPFTKTRLKTLKKWALCGLIRG